MFLPCIIYAMSDNKHERGDSRHDKKTAVVRFSPDDIELTVPHGTTIMQAARMAGLFMDAPCGARGTCGKCRVQAVGSVSEPSAHEVQILKRSDAPDTVRLACRTRIVGQAWVTFIKDTPRVLHTLASRLDLETDRENAGVVKSFDASENKTIVRFADGTEFSEEGNTTSVLYGVSVDIGTTSLEVSLRDFFQNKRLCVTTALNPQVGIAADVIGRIDHAVRIRDGKNQLKFLVINAINELIDEVCSTAGISASDIYQVALAGNSAMTYLALGLDASCLATLPFEPEQKNFEPMNAESLGLKVHSRARVLTLSLIGGFVGGDTTGMVLAVTASADRRPALYLDIGTNGELVLANAHAMFACSAAAGPAFEGGKIECGMRAGPGAVVHVDLEDGRVVCRVLSGIRANGLCGTGLLDAVSVLRYLGVVDDSGRMLGPDELPHRVSASVTDAIRGDGPNRRFILKDGEEPVYVSQRDVREFQLAVGALRAGISILAKHADILIDEIEVVYLAGALGNHFNIKNAVKTGLIPESLAERVDFAGNAAASGARLVLADRKQSKRAKMIAMDVNHISLSTDPQFQDLFADAMQFPKWE